MVYAPALPESAYDGFGVDAHVEFDKGQVLLAQDGGVENSHLHSAMTKGLAGQVGGDAVQDDIAAGGSRGYVVVVAIEGHTGYFFFVILKGAG